MAETGTGRGLIIRESDPENLEFPFASLDSLITPNEQFFVRNHFKTPVLHPETWQLKVEGQVSGSLTLSLDDLTSLPARKVTANLECAGNGRISLVPRAKGLLWDSGAVSNAEWTGVPLADVLQLAGIPDGTKEVILEGADSGVADDPKSPGPIHFARSIPLSKAMQPEVLLAYEMNGEPLSPLHGYPLRAVVPGWYGMASIKWLNRIVVSAEPFHGYYQSLEYSYFRTVAGVPTLTRVGEMNVKSQIARPTVHEAIARGSIYRIFGAAWTGEGKVIRVEVSTDGGVTWEDAALRGEAQQYVWRFWDYEWQTPEQPGACVLMARATDDAGRVQPMERDPAFRTYMISHVIPVEITLR